ncbi:hypothetical protein C8Q80DRAFT_451668 [Daedaleopsis nitida]|nr:hypothetical protein C8Q80DRAFT_451668 [Daedaleopsis nitida]
MEPYISDVLGKELEDAFATMLRGLSSTESVEIQRNPQSGTPIITGQDEQMNTLPTSAGPSDDIRGSESGQPSHDASSGVNTVLEDIRQQVSNNNPDAILQSLSGLLNGMMNLIPSVPQYQIPAAALPDYTEAHRDGVSAAVCGGLLNAKEYAATEVQGLTEYVTRAFRALDLVQENLQHTLASAATPPTLPTGSASASSSIMPGPASPSRLAAALADTGSFMSKMSESAGGTFAKETSRAVQGNPVYVPPRYRSAVPADAARHPRRVARISRAAKRVRDDAPPPLRARVRRE